MGDLGTTQKGGWFGPGVDAAEVTPSDSVDIVDGGGTTRVARSLSIGVAGALKITTYENNEEVYTNVPAGIFPVMARRVWSTGTAATGIVAIF